MSRAEPSGFVVALVLTSAAGAQQTLVVDPVAGPFFDLPPAVAAARPGDRIEARAGNYGGITLARGVEIYATGTATIVFVVVTGVPQGEVVVVDGFAVPALHQPNVEVDACLGPVSLRGVRGVAALRSSMKITNSAAVTLVDCDLAGGADYLGSVFPALRVTASTVVAIDSMFRGIDGAMSTALTVSNASSGIGMTGSDLTLIRCTVTGGNGANPTFCLGGVVGGNGAAAGAGGDVLRALGATVLTGGSGGTGGFGCPNGQAGPAASAATVRLGPAVVVNGAIGATAPAVDAVALDGPANPALGTTATFLVTTQPGDFVVLALAPAPASFTAVPGNDLPFVLPTPGMLVLGGQLATRGSPVQFPVPIPNAPQLAQQLLLAQGASLGATVHLTSPHYARLR